MWKTFVDIENVFMIKLEKNDVDFILLLTNISCLWESEFSTLNLVNSFKEYNPLIAAGDEQIVSDFIEIINNIQDVNTSVKSTGDNIELVLEQNCCGFGESVKSSKIIYKFTLNKKEQEQFKDKIVVSAIKTIYFLEKQQKMLLNLVQKKDRELEEFRMEKGEISRGDLKTEKFDANVLNTNNDELFLNVFTEKQSERFWQKFTETNGKVETTNMHVDLEPWNVKSRKRVILSGKSVAKRGSGIVYKK
ncbi:unnamed protein product [Ceutorhynchus assimilis]|uniref:Non-homologous end-joining factor 1 n=1 Tax=Ceutorhynchus assimilis TaxID=467358 RepID=A0A9N9MNS4_9CUCU|nr:unnamed protein product [Ceutorhynchus assimilis]